MCITHDFSSYFKSVRSPNPMIFLPSSYQSKPAQPMIFLPFSLIFSYNFNSLLCQNAIFFVLLHTNPKLYFFQTPYYFFLLHKNLIFTFQITNDFSGFFFLFNSHIFQIFTLSKPHHFFSFFIPIQIFSWCIIHDFFFHSQLYTILNFYFLQFPLFSFLLHTNQIFTLCITHDFRWFF